MHNPFNEISKPAFDLTPRARAAVQFLRAEKIFHVVMGPDDVHTGTVKIANRNLAYLPDLSAVTITGDFDCGGNRLMTLKGAPRLVSGQFRCADNLLLTLKGAPEKVGGAFICSQNRLRDLKGGPQETGGFDCAENDLESLEGAPRTAFRFICRDNKLGSLEGAPKNVYGHFDCSNNRLTDLQGVPAGLSTIDCSKNRLTSLKGLVHGFCGKIDATGNPLPDVSPLPGLEDLRLQAIVMTDSTPSGRAQARRGAGPALGAAGAQRKANCEKPACPDNGRDGAPAAPKSAKPRIRAGWPAAYWRKGPKP
jgi:hypothetical protein